METEPNQPTPPSTPTPVSVPMPNAPKKYPLIIIAVVVALVGTGIVYALMRGQVATQTPEETQTPRPTAAVPAGWEAYTDATNGFIVYHPAELVAGSAAPNSVLGTAQNPVGGIYVGPLVVIPLDTEALKTSANTYFNQHVQSAQLPNSKCKGMTYPVARFVVHCEGEGGPATYAYITGDTVDLFIDGYSRGYATAEQQLGTISNADIDTLIQTLKIE